MAHSRATDGDYLQTAQLEYQVEYEILFTHLHWWEVLKDCDKWSSVEVSEFIAQKEENKNKNYKSNGSGSFNTKESREGSFNLNIADVDEENEVQEVRPRRPMGRDQAKREGKGATSSASSASGADVKALARLIVNEYKRLVLHPKGPKPYRVDGDQKERVGSK
ncbi:retrovirus-related pol polyprotein from transposon TNT 1-94 [Tanacetum coccineum]